MVMWLVMKCFEDHPRHEISVFLFVHNAPNEWVIHMVSFCIRKPWILFGMQISSQKSLVKMQNGMGKPIWLVVLNMFSFSIQLGIIIPTGLSYFSEGLKPPTSNGFPKQMICKWWRVVATLRDCPVLWRSICQLLAAPMSKYNAWSFDWQNIATFELETYYLRTSKSLLGVHWWITISLQYIDKY